MSTVLSSPAPFFFVAIAVLFISEPFLYALARISRALPTSRSNRSGLLRLPSAFHSVLSMKSKWFFTVFNLVVRFPSSHRSQVSVPSLHRLN